MSRTRTAWTATLLSLGGLACAATYLHFRDGPPPDLSRFKRPEHDPVAFAELKRLTDRFETQYKEYKPVETGDPDEETAYDYAHTLNGLAMSQDANAVRALKRHLGENEAALETAREIIALNRVAWEPRYEGNELATAFNVGITVKKALKLLQRTCIVAGLEGRTAQAWRDVETMSLFARKCSAESSVLIEGAFALGFERLAMDTALRIARLETDAAPIAGHLAAMNGSRHDPLAFKPVIAGEVLGFARTFLPAYGGKRQLRSMISYSDAWKNWGNWKDSPTSPAVGAWNALNCLPNDTVAELADMTDKEFAINSPSPPKPPVETDLKIPSLLKNSGGRHISDIVAGSFGMIHSYYFSCSSYFDLTRLALALRIHQLRHGGQNPATLSELAPTLLPEIPVDVFNRGAPLHYDPQTGKIWSVGPDGIDDGGDHEYHDDLVVEMPPKPATT